MSNSSSHGHRRDLMVCPRCGSHYTQTLSAAYSRFPQDFELRDEPDLLPIRMQPPQRRSSFVLPACFGALTLAYSCVFSYIGALELGFLDGLESVHLGFVLPSIALALAIALYASRRASRWNSEELPRLLEKWHSTAICRRCSCQFPIVGQIAQSQ